MIQKILPQSSFIAFDCFALREPSLIWQNARCKEVDHLLKGAICRPVDAEVGLNLHDQPVQALAERYGGSGLSENGGGARCGLIDGIQIKGTGRNPLAGQGTDYWHKHGAISLQDCVKEVFWSEVLRDALPHGAVQSLAIVDCRSRFGVEIGESKSPGFATRALLLREPALRPAHFMRSVFYRGGATGSPQSEDLERTRAAIRVIPCLDPVMLGMVDRVDPVQARTSSDAVVWFVSTISKRAAAQLASARAKRIVHGSLIASNFAVDGRWLDFGTATATAGYSRYIVAPGGLDTWSQERAIMEGLLDLCFYVAKFSEVSKIAAADLARASGAAFAEELDERTKSEFLLLTGLPSGILRKLSRQVTDPLWALIGNVLNREKTGLHYYYGDARHEMPAQDQDRSLTSILLESARASTPVALEWSLIQLGCSVAFARSWATAYFEFRNAAASEEFVDPRDLKALNLGVRLRCEIANIDNAEIHRRVLDGKIDAMCRSGDIDNGLYSLIRRWNCVLGLAEDFDFAPLHVNGDLSEVRLRIDREGRFEVGGYPSDSETHFRLALQCIDKHVS